MFSFCYGRTNLQGNLYNCSGRYHMFGASMGGYISQVRAGPVFFLFLSSRHDRLARYASIVSLILFLNGCVRGSLFASILPNPLHVS